MRFCQGFLTGLRSGGLSSEIGRRRIGASDSEIKRARSHIQWAIGGMFPVLVGLLLILRV